MFESVRCKCTGDVYLEGDKKISSTVLQFAGDWKCSSMFVSTETQRTAEHYEDG